MSEKILDDFITSTPAGSLWRLNKAVADKFDRESLDRIGKRLSEKAAATLRELSPKYPNFERPHILKVGDSKNLRYFYRGKWSTYKNAEDSKLVMQFFDEDANGYKIKMYDRIDTEDKKEIIIPGGEYIAVFLMPFKYAENEVVIRDAVERVKSQENWDGIIFYQKPSRAKLFRCWLFGTHEWIDDYSSRLHGQQKCNICNIL